MSASKRRRTRTNSAKKSRKTTPKQTARDARIPPGYRDRWVDNEIDDSLAHIDRSTYRGRKFVAMIPAEPERRGPRAHPETQAHTYSCRLRCWHCLATPSTGGAAVATRASNCLLLATSTQLLLVARGTQQLTDLQGGTLPFEECLWTDRRRRRRSSCSRRGIASLSTLARGRPTRSTNEEYGYDTTGALCARASAGISAGRRLLAQHRRSHQHAAAWVSISPQGGQTNCRFTNPRKGSTRANIVATRNIYQGEDTCGIRQRL